MSGDSALGGYAGTIQAGRGSAQLAPNLTHRLVDVGQLSFQLNNLPLPSKVVVDDVTDRLKLARLDFEGLSDLHELRRVPFDRFLNGCEIRPHLGHLTTHVRHKAKQVADRGFLRVRHAVVSKRLARTPSPIIKNNDFWSLNNRQGHKSTNLTPRYDEGSLTCGLETQTVGGMPPTDAEVLDQVQVYLQSLGDGA